MPLWAQISTAGVLALAITLWAGQWLQARRVAGMAAALVARAQEQSRQSRAAHSLDGLPPPVRRYLDRALPRDRRGLMLVRYEQAGTLRTDPMRERWIPFTASHVISPGTTEFLWTARVSISPLLHVQVRDSLIGGRGAGHVTLLSAIPVSAEGDRMEMNSGSLHRFLAEAVWYPSALLPSPLLKWEPLDDRRAVATLSDGATTVSLEFRFNSENEVSGIYTPGRWGSFDGAFAQVGWEGKFRAYTRRQGVLVPNEGEVGWHVDGEWRSVWRGRVTSVFMQFS